MNPVRRVAGWLIRAVMALVIIVSLGIVVVPPFLDRIYYRGSATGHFDGQRFRNPDGDDVIGPRPKGGRGNWLWQMLTGDDRPRWPDHVAPVANRVPARVEGERMLVTWIGHASVLVQTQGLNILTDPVWSDRVGPFDLLGPERVAPPGIAFDRLPKIDIVVVSHNHYDHMDLATIARLWRRDRPLIISSLGNDAIIRRAGGARVVTRDWGGRVPVKPGVEVVVTRNHHWTSRWFVDRNRALWSSFVIRLPHGNVFFAGDTGAGDLRWPGEAARYGPIRLALLPIGAFRFGPGQMDAGPHMGPFRAVEVFRRLGAAYGLGIHWGTFHLSSEAYRDPPDLLAQGVRRAGVAPDHFRTLPIGGQWDIPALR